MSTPAHDTKSEMSMYHHMRLRPGSKGRRKVYSTSKKKKVFRERVRSWKKRYIR